MTKELHSSTKTKILLAPFLLAISLPAFAEVDPKIHKLCIEAKDYSGCVRSMTGKTSTETTVNQIQRQGANLTEGNMCPAQHLSSGGGYCQRVVCMKAGLWGKGHGDGLGGKGNTCKRGAELTWEYNSPPVRASFDKRCPPDNLDIGFRNTCFQGKVRGYATFYSSGINIDSSKNNEVVGVYGEPAKGKIKIGDKVISISGLKPTNNNDMHNPSIKTFVIERQGKELEFTWTTRLQRVNFPKEIKP